jgi:hypothetical protein
MYNNKMSGKLRLKDFIIFAQSTDDNLFKFCEYICTKNQYNEVVLQKFVHRLKNTKNIGLFIFLRIIHFTNTWIELRSICHFVLSMHDKMKKKIEYKQYGCIVSHNFIKYNYSLTDRIDVLQKILKERI